MDSNERWTFDPSKREGRYGSEHDIQIKGPDGLRIATLYPAVVPAEEADGTPYPLHRCPLDPKVIERGRLMAAAPKLFKALDELYLACKDLDAFKGCDGQPCVEVFMAREALAEAAGTDAAAYR
jgi:hypothetical protein